MARDYAFEALAEVTGTDWNTGRGELNKALSLIREQAQIEDSYVLADEIHARARMYREVMGQDVLLTAPALAKHWKRVHEETQRRSEPSRTWHPSKPQDCDTCNGDRFVLLYLRPAQPHYVNTVQVPPAKNGRYEEYAPCPECNPVQVYGVPSPDRVREHMSKRV